MEEKKANIEIKSCFLSITIDKTMKESFTDLCKKNGLDFSYANALFIKQCLKIDDIPFENDQMSNNKKGKQKKDPVRCSIRISPEERNAFKYLCKKKNVKMIDSLKMFMGIAIQNKKFPFSN